MQKTITVSAANLDTLEKALSAMAQFKRTFGRRLDDAIIAEIYVAHELGLEISSSANEQGYDLVSSSGVRYQVKCRDIGTQNIDLNNFDFDYAVLVNLDDEYGLAGIWQMTVETTREVFVLREKFRKYQTTQSKFKASAERIR